MSDPHRTATSTSSPEVLSTISLKITGVENMYSSKTSKDGKNATTAGSLKMARDERERAKAGYSLAPTLPKKKLRS